MTKNIPPHLPKPMSNIKNHQLKERIKSILMASLIGLLAGLSGASILFGWLLPSEFGNNIFIASQTKTNAEPEMNELIKKELLDRIYFVYSKTTKINGLQYLEQSDLLGQAAAISSDGWLVFYSGQNLTNNNLLIFNDKNVQEKISQTIYDQSTGLSFIKIKNDNQLKLVSFKNDISKDDPLFVYADKEWNITYLRKQTPTELDNHLDIEPSFYYLLKDNQIKNSLFFNQQGNVSGFLVSDNIALPAKYLARILAKFLADKTIIYDSLGVRGFYDSERPIISRPNTSGSFAISQVYNKNQNKLKAGDIILEINGSVVNEDNLWYNITNKTSVSVTLLRNGNKLLVEGVPVFKL